MIRGQVSRFQVGYIAKPQPTMLSETAKIKAINSVGGQNRLERARNKITKGEETVNYNVLHSCMIIESNSRLYAKSPLLSLVKFKIKRKLHV